jgi:hypothetical protein
VDRFPGRKRPTVCLRSSNELKQAGARMVRFQRQ